jgi:hypothetical protein
VKITFTCSAALVHGSSVGGLATEERGIKAPALKHTMFRYIGRYSALKDVMRYSCFGSCRGAWRFDE